MKHHQNLIIKSNLKSIFSNIYIIKIFSSNQLGRWKKEAHNLSIIQSTIVSQRSSNIPFIEFLARHGAKPVNASRVFEVSIKVAWPRSTARITIKIGWKFNKAILGWRLYIRGHVSVFRKPPQFLNVPPTIPKIRPWQELPVDLTSQVSRVTLSAIT